MDRFQSINPNLCLGERSDQGTGREVTCTASINLRPPLPLCLPTPVASEVFASSRKLPHNATMGHGPGLIPSSCSTPVPRQRTRRTKRRSLRRIPPSHSSIDFYLSPRLTRRHQRVGGGGGGGRNEQKRFRNESNLMSRLQIGKV